MAACAQLEIPDIQELMQSFSRQPAKAPTQQPYKQTAPSPSADLDLSSFESEIELEDKETLRQERERLWRYERDNRKPREEGRDEETELLCSSELSRCTSSKGDERDYGLCRDQYEVCQGLLSEDSRKLSLPPMIEKDLHCLTLLSRCEERALTDAPSSQCYGIYRDCLSSQ